LRVTSSLLCENMNYHLGGFLSFQVKLTKLKEMEVTHNSWPDATLRRTASNHHHCTHYHFPHQRRLIADSKTPPLPRERSLFLEPPVFFLSVENTNSLHSAWSTSRFTPFKFCCVWVRRETSDWIQALLVSKIRRKAENLYSIFLFLTVETDWSLVRTYCSASCLLYLTFSQ